MRDGLPEAFSRAPLISDWISFDEPGLVTVLTGKVELGQGILTALRQMAAEELKISPERIQLLSGQTNITPDERYTVGSLSIVTSGRAIRLACAHARTILIRRFASRICCSPDIVKVVDGNFSRPNSTDQSSYWQEWRTSDLGIPIQDIGGLTPAREFRWIGQPIQRSDLREKITGEAFIHDLHFPEMVYAHAIRGHGLDIEEGKLRQLTSKFATSASFVREGRFLAVYSGSEAVTRRVSEFVRQNLFPDRDEAQPVGPEDFPSRPVKTEVFEAPGSTSLRNSARQLRACYSRQYLSHGSIGPSCAVAHFNGKVLQVWTHSQGVYPLRDALAKVLRIDPQDAVVHHVYGAGCYGHNGADDAACDAAIVAKHVPGRHVRVQWTRRDELRTAPYGAASLVQLEAGIDQNGMPTSWSIEIWSPTHNQRPGTRGAPGLLGGEEVDAEANKMPPGDVPLERGGGATRNAFAPYRLPVQKLTHHLIEDPEIRTSALRGLGAQANVFAIESFIDELAAAASIDPLDYRLALLDDDRAKAVLSRVAEMASWSSRPQGSEGSGFGIAFSRYKNIAAYVAIIAMVNIAENVFVPKVWCCADAGLIINPDGALNQIQGGIVQATSWTIREGTRPNAGGLPQRWEDYPILRFSEVPEVAIEMIPSSDNQPLGVGEVTVGPTSAAIANAVAAALGQRIRKLPFTRDEMTKSLLDSDANEGVG